MTEPHEALRDAYQATAEGKPRLAADLVAQALDRFLAQMDMGHASQLLREANVASLSTPALTALCSVGRHARFVRGFSDTYPHYVDRALRELERRGVDETRMSRIRKRFVDPPPSACVRLTEKLYALQEKEKEKMADHRTEKPSLTWSEAQAAPLCVAPARRLGPCPCARCRSYYCAPHAPGHVEPEPKPGAEEALRDLLEAMKRGAVVTTTASAPRTVPDMTVSFYVDTEFGPVCTGKAKWF